MASHHNPFKQSTKQHKLRLIRVLLVLPAACALWVSSYNAPEPGFIGIPFFYWYQLLWVALSAILTGIVYLVER
jgi:hypothetical protein